MKRKTYNNVMKATKMIQKKGYDFEEASQMAIRLFDEHTDGMNSIEFYIGKILDKETWKRESRITGRFQEPQPDSEDKNRIENNNYKLYMEGKIKDLEIPFK